MPRLLVNLFSALLLLGVSACVATGQEPHRNRVTTTPPPEAQAAPAPPAQLPPQEPMNRMPVNVPVVRVALLLPMSGESQALGQSLLDASTLALHDIYMPLKPDQIHARIILIPKDTGSSPASAASAAEQAVGQGVSLIIGPFYGASVSAAAPVAHKSGVPMLSLSNNKAVAGDNVYVFGFLPEQQIQRVAEYAARVNVSSFGALLPNDAYGSTVSETLKSSLAGRGISVDPVEMYARTSSNLEAAAIRLRAGYDKNKFQALFIADGGDELKEMLASLKNHGLDRKSVRLIGTGLWDDEEVRNNPDMLGAWFASSPPHYYTEFERHFVAAYGYKPQRLASLTYDAVMLAATLAMNGGGPNYSAQVLTNPQGFIGPANGLYRLKPDGTSERALSIMEISAGGGVKMLDSAPMTFEQPKETVSAPLKPVMPSAQPSPH